MKTSQKILLVIAIIGVVLGCFTFSDTKLFLKGDTVDLSDDPSCFEEEALCQGTINFVYGPFAVLEETRKRYGITTGKTDTDFFIVSDLANGGENPTFVVLSTSNKERIKEFTDAADEWAKWIDGEIKDYPDVSINFKGRLQDQISHKDFAPMLNEQKSNFKTYLGVSESQFATLRIVDRQITTVTVAMCFGSFGIGILCVVLLIVSLIKSKKKPKDGIIDEVAPVGNDVL